MASKNDFMNNFIRAKAGRVATVAPPTDPNAPPRTPPGNAGSGAGSPPPPRPASMNDVIRAVALSGYKGTF